MPALVQFEFGGTTRHPTSDGRTLEVSGEVLAGELSLRYVFRDPESSLPKDAIACDFRIADCEGQVWQTTSTFTTELFVVHMYDISSIGSTGLFTKRKAEESWVRAFESDVLLEDARFGTDDRFYRTLLVNQKREPVVFKYTVLHFDVAVRAGGSAFLTDLAVRIHRGGFWYEGSTLPEMGFFLSCRHLLRANTAVCHSSRGFWVDAPIPMPLIFEPIGESAAPQLGVRVLGAESRRGSRQLRSG